MNGIAVVIVVAQRGENTDRQKQSTHYHQPQRTADWPSSFSGNWNARWWILARAIHTEKRRVWLSASFAVRGLVNTALVWYKEWCVTLIGWFISWQCSFPAGVAAVSGGCCFKLASYSSPKRACIGQPLPLLTCVSTVTVLLDTDISYWTGNKWHFPRQLVNF